MNRMQKEGRKDRKRDRQSETQMRGGGRDSTANARLPLRWGSCDSIHKWLDGARLWNVCIERSWCVCVCVCVNVWTFRLTSAARWESISLHQSLCCPHRPMLGPKPMCQCAGMPKPAVSSRSPSPSPLPSLFCSSLAFLLGLSLLFPVCCSSSFPTSLCHLLLTAVRSPPPPPPPVRWVLCLIFVPRERFRGLTRFPVILLMHTGVIIQTAQLWQHGMESLWSSNPVVSDNVTHSLEGRVTRTPPYNLGITHTLTHTYTHTFPVSEHMGFLHSLPHVPPTQQPWSSGQLSSERPDGPPVCTLLTPCLITLVHQESLLGCCPISGCDSGWTVPVLSCHTHTHTLSLSDSSSLPGEAWKEINFHPYFQFNYFYLPQKLSFKLTSTVAACKDVSDKSLEWSRQFCSHISRMGARRFHQK